ncbi:hypothetical protein WR25_18535 [Diploscapter pachys]|uniref:Transthyretin-like family protein n=1 Tax=Diploscapter pachys TaxID=2018661 RepID=A0A2A2LGI9_9BILA|nr:hypothetical protein WR25_18535 [Diploscapter pachys]
MTIIMKNLSPDPDDLLDQGYSAQNGSFFLEGKTEEGTPIDPTLKIYHNCNDELEPGYRKVVFTLPDKSITRAAKPNSTFDAGVIQLELEFKDEEREFTID